MKKGVLLSIITFLVLINSVCISYSSELTDDYLDIAQNYFNANNYSKAIEYLNEVIKIEPDNKQALELKNKIAPTSCEKIQKAEEQSTAKVLSNTQNPENFVMLDVPTADVEKMDYNSDYYNQKGQEYYKQCDYNSAVEYFFKAIRINKRNAQAYNNLGMAYLAKKNAPCAIKYLKKSYSINNNYTQPLVNLAMYYKQAGNEKLEVKYLKRAIKSNANDFQAYFLLGEFYRSKALYIKAISSYKSAIDIAPNCPDAYFGLGFAYFETEDFNYAAAAFSKYAELKPNCDYAYYMLAKTFLVLNKYDYAKNSIEKAIAINASNDYEYELARIDYYLEDYKGAIEVLENLMISSNSAEYFNYAGLCNYKMKNIDAAIANFNKAIELDSLRPIYYYNLAQCYKSIGDKKNYVKNVNTSTKITPINYQDFIDLSYIYYDNGNPGFAINSLNDAIKKYPTVKALYLSKLKIYEAIGDNLHYNETKNNINERFNTNDNEKKTLQSKK